MNRNIYHWGVLPRKDSATCGKEELIGFMQDQ